MRTFLRVVDQAEGVSTCRTICPVQGLWYDLGEEGSIPTGRPAHVQLTAAPRSSPAKGTREKTSARTAAEDLQPTPPWPAHPGTVGPFPEAAACLMLSKM